MTVNSIINNKYAYNFDTKTATKNGVENTKNANIFDYSQTSNVKKSSNDLSARENSELNFKNAQTKEDKIAILKALYENSKNEQGIIGKLGDGFKNLFNTKNCSNNIEKAINSLNSNSTDEEIQAVKDMLDKYNSNQDSVVKGVATTGAMVTGAAAGAKVGAIIGSVFPGIGNLVGLAIGAVAGAAVGAVTSICINQAENMTDNVKGNSWHNDKIC